MEIITLFIKNTKLVTFILKTMTGFLRQKKIHLKHFTKKLWKNKIGRKIIHGKRLR